MPKAHVNGIDLYYESHGEGPVIVFAHGAGGSHLSWWQQVSFFSQRYRCITFDHRAFGQSLSEPEGPGVEAFTDDLIGLLDYLGIAECRVVSQSMGGVCGFGLTLSQPQRVKALVMADTMLGIPSKEFLHLRDDLVRRGVLRTPGSGPAPGGPFAPNFSQREPALAFLYAQLAALNPPRDTERFSRGMWEGSGERDLSSFAVPTLFLFGAEDRTFPPAFGQLAQQLVPGSRFVEVAGAGHSVYWEKPDEFNRLVSGFFTEVGA